MKIKNCLILSMLMGNTAVCGMYGRVTEKEVGERALREQKQELQEKRFARCEQHMAIVETYFLMKIKEAQEQKKSINTKSPSEGIYKHQDQQAKL